MSTERSALIRLASTMPKGSAERKAVLKTLSKKASPQNYTQGWKDKGAYQILNVVVPGLISFTGYISRGQSADQFNWVLESYLDKNGRLSLLSKADGESSSVRTAQTMVARQLGVMIAKGPLVGWVEKLAALRREANELEKTIMEVSDLPKFLDNLPPS